MYEGFTEAVREELSHARIVIDRFHVARAYRDGLDDLRKQELGRLKKELPDVEYKQLKGSMWALRKKPADLDSEERHTLRLLFRYSPKLKQAYDLQQQLTAIFDPPSPQHPPKPKSGPESNASQEVSCAALTSSSTPWVAGGWKSSTISSTEQ